MIGVRFHDNWDRTFGVPVLGCPGIRYKDEGMIGAEIDENNEVVRVHKFGHFEWPDQALPLPPGCAIPNLGVPKEELGG